MNAPRDMDVSTATDEELVALTRTSKDFFGVIVERYEAKLLRYVARLGVRDSEDAADVLQDIFIKTYRNLNGFDTSLKFSSWVYRIAHNEVMSWHRKRSVRPEKTVVGGEELIDLALFEENTSEEEFDNDLMREHIGDVLSKLDDRYRDVIILNYFEHKSYEEISDILEIPVGTVGTLLHRAKKQLKTLLEQHPQTYGS